MITDQILPHHLEDLKVKSGLTDETLQKYKVFSVTTEEQLYDAVRKRVLNGVSDALAFEYPGTDGHCRLKLFPSDNPKGKYYHQYGDALHLFTTLEARAILADPSQPIAFVEGEKKSMRLAQEGIPCIGIGGIWNHMQNNIPLADFNDIAWQDRNVTIYADSNTWMKENVQLGLYVLCMELERRGAVVTILIIPMDGETHQGVDDYLVKGGSLNQLAILKFSGRGGFKSNDRIAEAYDRHEKRKKGKVEQKAAAEKKKITSEEFEKALALLRDPELLQIFVDTTESLGCVGETENKISLFLAMTSRLLEKPISMVLKGESSVGKNFLVDTVSQFIPITELIKISAMTARSLFYLDSDTSHKIMLIAEIGGSDAADYSIRTAQSEGELTILTVQKEDGQFQTQRKTVKGPICFITTTTKMRLHAENQTRVVDLYPDDSQKQTGEILEIIKRGEMLELPADVREKVNVWRNAQACLEQLDVFIPFVKHIKFPSTPVRMRRDFPRFLFMLKAVAFLYQFQRERITFHNQQMIVANLQDYERARSLVEPMLKVAITECSRKTEELIRDATKFRGEDSFTRKELESVLCSLTDEHPARPKWHRGTFDEHMGEALRLGCVETVGERKQGKAIEYKFIQSLEAQIDPLCSVDEIESSMEAQRDMEKIEDE